MKTVFYNNENRTIKSLSKEFGIKITTLHNRIFRYGWPVQKAIHLQAQNKLVHGNSSTDPEYTAWSDIKSRCLNQKNKFYHRYGRRGITICDRWKNSYDNFIKDMGRRPGVGFSIDRINNDGNYEPLNCRWATRKEQDNNRSDNRNITYHGETHTITEWGRFLGFKRNVIDDRLKNGMSIEEAFETQTALHEITIVHDGRSQNISGWAKEAGISAVCFSKRIELGWTMDKILKIPSAKNKIFHNGKYFTRTALAKEYNLTPDGFRNRLKKGMSIEEALSKPKWKKI